jgi:hypothetical protein
MFEAAKLQMNWARASGSRIRHGESPVLLASIGGLAA